jgi:hypothetical protein
MVDRADERRSLVGIRNRRGMCMEAALADLLTEIRRSGEGLERVHSWP